MVIWNQKKYVEDVLLKNGINTNRISKDIYIISKYYLNQGKLDNEILIILRNMVNQVLPDGSLQKNINFIFNKVKELPSYSLDNEIMYITKNEINTILNFTDKIKEQKLIFTMLVIYKFMGCDFYNFIFSDIFKYAKVKRNNELLENIIHRMVVKGLITKYEDNTKKELLRKLNFTELNNESEVEITITNFENFILYFDNYCFKTKIGNCQNCNIKIQIKSNRQKFCDECWKEINREQIRLRVQKHRNKQCNGLENPHKP